MNMHWFVWFQQSVVVVEQEDPAEKCRELTPEQLMSSQLAVSSTLNLAVIIKYYTLA